MILVNSVNFYGSHGHKSCTLHHCWKWYIYLILTEGLVYVWFKFISIVQLCSCHVHEIRVEPYLILIFFQWLDLEQTQFFEILLNILFCINCCLNYLKIIKFCQISILFQMPVVKGKKKNIHVQFYQLKLALWNYF